MNLHWLLRNREMERLAKELGGVHDVGGFFRSQSIQLTRGRWNVGIDFLESKSERESFLLQAHARYIPDAFFEFYVAPAARAGSVTNLMLGIPHVEGLPAFANAHALWSNDEARARRLFDSRTFASVAEVGALDRLYVWDANDARTAADLRCVLEPRHRSASDAQKAIAAVVEIAESLHALGWATPS